MKIPKNIHVTTLGGNKFYLDNPYKSVITIEDISWSLSNLCRWNSHVNKFYSVAQHCVVVSSLCSEPLKLQGLMHDCEEAYIGDFTSPLKEMFPELRIYGKSLKKYILQELKVINIGEEKVKKIDIEVGLIEDQALRKTAINEKPMLVYWDPWRANNEFLRLYNKYCSVKAQ